MSIFVLNIHESIKDEFIEDLNNQTLALGKIFATIVAVISSLLMVLDIFLGWSSVLLVFRIPPFFSAILYLVYIQFFHEKFLKFFSYVYGFVILSCILSASGICYKIFTHLDVQNIDKLSTALCCAMTILVCYLFAGITIVSLLWIIGVPLIGSFILIYANLPVFSIFDAMALGTPLCVFIAIALLSGEYFFLKTKYFAVNKRILNQFDVLQELKTNYKNLNDENLFLIEQLKSNATFDLLTAAFNRGAGLELLEKEFYFAQRNSESMTLAYLKIESIEWINHEYGKDFADNIILSVAQILKDTIRKSDLLVRVEIDEFLVIFRQCENRFAKKVIERAKSRTAGLSSQSKFEIKFNAGFADSANDEISSSKQMVEIAYQQMKLDSELKQFSPPPILQGEDESDNSDQPELSSVQSKVS